MNAIRVFEVAAEHESFVAAADELHVTRGAVSQQIKQLEDYLGLALFERLGRGLVLTDAGRRYHSAARNALNVLERETLRHVAQGSTKTIRLSVLPAIASLWLVPRLSDFQKQFEDVEVQVSADAELVDFSRPDTQIGIRFGLGDVKGCEYIELGVDRILPVCTPQYKTTHEINTIRDVEGCRLLHDTYWVNDWPYWEEQAKSPLPSQVTGQYFTHYSLAVDAALASSGLLMGHQFLLQKHLNSGELVPISDTIISCTAPYFVVYPRRLKFQREIQAFVGWITNRFENAMASRTQLL